MGVDSLADFKLVIEEVNAIDPDFHALRCPANRIEHVHEFLACLDAVLALPDGTADALADMSLLMNASTLQLSALSRS
jgi:hypothetical protein